MTKFLIYWIGLLQTVLARLSSYLRLKIAIRRPPPDVMALAAAHYSSVGDPASALIFWERSDSDFSLACQDALKMPGATDESLALVQQKWVDRNIGDRPWVSMPARDRQRIRVGYHCSFMDSDTIRYMMGKVFRAHDPVRVQVFGYGSMPSPDLPDCFSTYKYTVGLTDQQFADLIKEDEIDVLVELSGFSPGHRFGAMSLRAAPVQISYLNHCGTSGVPNVDYVLADHIALPSDPPYYSEEVYRLPRCFFCFDYKDSSALVGHYYTPVEEILSKAVSYPPSTKIGKVTFGCFGSGNKINDELIGLWARVLDAVPNSVLRLKNGYLTDPRRRSLLYAKFEKHGLRKDRIDLRPGGSRSGVLVDYGGIDISLDTWPYCGGNTIAESIWMGVPVVTLKGDRFASSYGASLVTAAGCPGLVAKDEDEYVRIAAELAGDVERRRMLRVDLRSLMFDHGLGDSKSMAKALEDAYFDMLSRLPKGD